MPLFPQLHFLVFYTRNYFICSLSQGRLYNYMSTMKTTLQKTFALSLLTFLLSILVFVSNAQSIQTFTISGPWVCPVGVTTITVETWGGGGAGVAAPPNSVGSGGGGGAYKITTGVVVSAGTSYPCVVGAGGIGNNSGSGGNGSLSSFNGLYIANPGTGGISIGISGVGGIGGTYDGGNGGIGIGSASGGGGGGAGSTGSGGNGGTPTKGLGGGTDGGAGGVGVNSNSNGNIGIIIGGGGSGAFNNKNSGQGKLGGNGARGQVRISYTIACTAPSVQPTGLILTAGQNNISGSFTAALNTDGYLVIRTTTSTAPTAPVNGVTYSAGTNALGGFIEGSSNATGFNSLGLSVTTQYWYWIYGYNNVSCSGGIKYLSSSPLNGNATTVSCGTATNSALVTSTAGGSYNSNLDTWSINWSTLSWSLGHTPTACENVTLTIDRTAATIPENININLDVNVSVKNLLMRNVSNTAYRIVFQIASPTTGARDILIDGSCSIECPGGTVSNKFNRCSILNNGRVTINGDVILGRAATLTATNEGHSSIGSGNADKTTFPNQILTFYGDMTFNPRGYTVDEYTVFIFNKAGTQYIYNYTRPLITDTLQPILFEDLRIGTSNTTNVVMAGTMFDGYIELMGRAGITIGVNSTLDMPANYSFNVIKGGLTSALKMLPGSKLRLGGDMSVPDVLNVSHGVAGSNFPGSFSPYVFDPTSTIEYYGSNSITQTIFNPPTYANLLATNGSGSGRAIKQTIAGTLKVNTSFNINALADVYLGTNTAIGLGTSTAPVTSTGPLNINATGGLYCNANIVSGTGAFTMGNGSYLGMGHVQGISISGNATGNIQMTGGRTYNSTGNYIYNGILNQVTGSGLPTTVNDLTTDNPSIVTIATNQLVNGVDSLKQGTFDIGSTRITHNGTGTLNSIGGFMKANLGIVEMKGTSGTAQNLSGNWFINSTISSLINANTKGMTVSAAPASNLLISSSLVYGAVSNSAITTNDNLTLLSRDTATASFGTMISGNSITGKVTIERYLPAKKSWRLLAAPIANATSPTVTAAWREGGASLTGTGYGTRITGPAGFTGVDDYTQRASMKYYDPASNNYINVSNTNTLLISNTQGYYVFVRGDRSVAPSGAAIPTILRIKGDVVTGTQSVLVPSGKFISLGNPYPSRINVQSLLKLKISNAFTAWNPNSLGVYNVGAFETYTWDGFNYKQPGGAIRNFIESGEAVFLQSNDIANPGSISIQESDKFTGSSLQSKLVTNVLKETLIPTLEINMYANYPDGSSYLADGVWLNFDDNFTNQTDNDDVRKIINVADNFSIKNNNALFVVERRAKLLVTDTIKFNLTGTRINTYHFKIDPSVLNNTGLDAFLIDKFLASEIAVSLLNHTNYNFNITADASSKMADRFMIVFKQVTPMRFIKITAVREKNNTATVTWYTENENNVHTYTIESSKDGVNFIEIGKQMPTANNNGNPYYRYIHTTPIDGNNWYRVKATAITGASQYSEIIKIDAKEKEVPTAITLFPNPVLEGKVHVSFASVSEGKYQLSVNNMDGQIIYSETLQLQTNNLKKTISLGIVAAGNYQLIIKDEKGDSKKISFIVK